MGGVVPRLRLTCLTTDIASDRHNQGLPWQQNYCLKLDKIALSRGHVGLVQPKGAFVYVCVYVVGGK